MTIFIDLTYRIITLRYDLIGLTIFTLDCVWFFAFLSCVIWCVIWWVWCILTRFLNLFTLLIHISNNYFTFWLFFKFVNIGYILITFDDFTSCWVCWLQVTIFINFTYCVVTSWNQFVSITFEFNLLWTVVYNCVVVFVYWLSFFISNIFLDCLAFCINIVYIDITIHFFINISDSWFWFSNLTCNWIRLLKVTIFIDLTYRIITLRYNLICLTIFCLDEVRFFAFLSCVIWCFVWWVWCILTWFLNLFTLLIHVSDNNFTYFKFVDVSYILILFSNCTCCWVWWCKMPLIINFTYCVVPRWN